jgi:hypothetical protein
MEVTVGSRCELLWIWESGAGLPQKFNGVSDANILVDKKSGDIYFNSKYRRIKQTIKVSFDDGKTWPE